METCRTCAKCVFYNESTDWIDLFHPTSGQQECQQIIRELDNWHLNISANDGLPQKICADCFTKLCDIFVFHAECLEAQQRLNTIFDKIDDDAEEAAAADDDADATELMHEMQVSQMPTEQHHTNTNATTINSDNVTVNYTAPYECNAQGNAVIVAAPRFNVNDTNNNNNNNRNNSNDYEKFLSTEEKDDIPQFAVLLLEELPLDDLIEEDIPQEDDMMLMQVMNGASVRDEDGGDVIQTQPITAVNNDEDYDNMQYSYECKYCYKTKKRPSEQFTSQDSLYAHITGCHDKEKPYNCAFCKEIFTDTGLRSSHIKEKHIKKDFECEVCGKMYAHRLNLKEHIEKFHSDQDFMCDQCNKSFFSQRSLKYHQKWHNSKRLLNCSYCDRIFINRKLLNNHEATHTGIRKLEYCTYCGKSFCHMKGLRYHIYCKHNGEKPYKCRHCPEKFASYREKRIHMLDMHQNNLTTLEKTECMLCHNFFQNEGALKDHMLTAHDATPRKPLITENNKRVIQSKREKCFSGVFQCEFCTQRFNMRSALERHMVMHSTEGRPHECPQCLKRFKRLPDLNWHLKTHSGEKPNVCDVCGKGFALKYVLNQHRRSHEVLEKNFTCSTCGRSYLFEKSLRNHERTHTGRTYYACDLCGETFVTHIQFKWHMNKEHSDAENIDLYDNLDEVDSVLPTDDLFDVIAH